MEDKVRTLKVEQRALIINPDKEILVINSDEFGWDLPGGLLIEGYNWQESLERSIAAKTGLEVMTKQPFYADDFENPNTGEYIYLTVIACEVFSSDVTPRDDDNLEWVDLQTANELNFSTAPITNAVRAYTGSMLG